MEYSLVWSWNDCETNVYEPKDVQSDSKVNSYDQVSSQFAVQQDFGCGIGSDANLAVVKGE